MKISYRQLESSCNELHSLAQNMKETMENVENIGKKISSSNIWNGEASDYYVKKLKKLTKNFDEAFKEIENSILYMAKCSSGYQALDQTIMKEICNNLNITSPNLNTSNIFNGG